MFPDKKGCKCKFRIIFFRIILHPISKNKKKDEWFGLIFFQNYSIQFAV